MVAQVALRSQSASNSEPTTVGVSGIYLGPRNQEVNTEGPIDLQTL